ncbi:MAG TPA: type IV pilus modification protein PilV [Gammaproteobacteria bacterium]|nr:type IV pilus modification protein PilV [Gammaproteobacteria bacterium]
MKGGGAMFSSESGFSMIEVLISMVVLSVGLLGMAQLQIFSMKMNHSAYLRTQASLLAEDMIERMRGNPIAVDKGSYDGLPDPQRVTGCQTTTGCAPTEMARNDAFDWRLTLAATLPSGQGVVCVDSTPEDGASVNAPACDGAGALRVIKVWWLDDRAKGGLTRFSTSFRP